MFHFRLGYIWYSLDQQRLGIAGIGPAGLCQMTSSFAYFKKLTDDHKTRTL